MFRIIFFVFTVSMTVSCTQKNEPKPPTTIDNVALDTVAVLSDPLSNLNIQTNSFTEIDSSGILMFPLSMSESERDGGSLSYKSIPVNSFWNIVFLNGKTNEYHLLSEKKMLIRNYDFKNSNTYNMDMSYTNRHIFYSITTDDFNKDKRLTEDDPAYLFVSDREGRNFRQISPSNHDLQNWQFIKSANKIILTVRKDNDKNSKFDNNDEVLAFEFDLNKGMEPKEIFSTEFKNKLKLLFDRDWKHPKE